MARAPRVFLHRVLLRHRKEVFVTFENRSLADVVSRLENIAQEDAFINFVTLGAPPIGSVTAVMLVPLTPGDECTIVTSKPTDEYSTAVFEALRGLMDVRMQ